MVTRDLWIFLILFAGFSGVLFLATAIIAQLETFVPGRNSRGQLLEREQEAQNQDRAETVYPGGTTNSNLYGGLTVVATGALGERPLNRRVEGSGKAKTFSLQNPNPKPAYSKQPTPDPIAPLCRRSAGLP